jgi:hypothetical protein
MPTPSSPFDPRVEQLFLEYLARRDGGEEPDVDALCEANPQQAVQFRQLLAAYDAASRLRPRADSAPLVERLKQQFGEGVDPAVSLGGEPASDAGSQSKLFERLRAEGPRTRYKLLGDRARALPRRSAGDVAARPPGCRAGARTRPRPAARCTSRCGW